MNDAAVNQRTDRVLFVWLFLTSVFGVLMGLPWTLLPRISRLGSWAPFLNSVLFSVYHFFTPWQNPLRIMALTPVFYAVWQRKNIFLGIIVYCPMNLAGSLMLLMTILRLTGSR